MNVTIVCDGGWKYTGKVIDTEKSSLLKLQWIVIETKTGKISINTDKIVSILSK